MNTGVESITLGDLASVICFVASLITAGTVITKFAVKSVSKVFSEQLKPINAKISAIEMANCKNYLVQTISEIEAGYPVNQVAKERFWENYDQYIELGGNSYVHSEVEKLKKEGKL